MKKLAFAAVFMCMFILLGCPAQTERSMDDGSYKVPSWLSGNWQQVNKNSTVMQTYYIEPVTNKTGHFTVYKINTEGHRETPGRKCILSNISGTVFLSAHDPGDDVSMEGWYIFKLKEISKTEFEIIPVKEHAINYSATPEEVRTFLKENKDKEETYETAEIERYTKVN